MWNGENNNPSLLEALNILLGITSKKLNYYSRKNGFEVPTDEGFWPEHLADYLDFEKVTNERVLPAEGE